MATLLVVFLASYYIESIQLSIFQTKMFPGRTIIYRR